MRFLSFYEKLEIRPNIESLVWLVLTDETFVLLKQIFSSLFLLNVAKCRKIFLIWSPYQKGPRKKCLSQLLCYVKKLVVRNFVHFFLKVVEWKKTALFESILTNRKLPDVHKKVKTFSTMNSYSILTKSVLGKLRYVERETYCCPDFSSSFEFGTQDCTDRKINF